MLLFCRPVLPWGLQVRDVLVDCTSFLSFSILAHEFLSLVGDVDFWISVVSDPSAHPGRPGSCTTGVHLSRGLCGNRPPYSPAHFVEPCMLGRLIPVWQLHRVTSNDPVEDVATNHGCRPSYTLHLVALTFLALEVVAHPSADSRPASAKPENPGNSPILG